MQQLSEHDAVCTSYDDGSAVSTARTTPPEDGASDNSPLMVVPISGEAAPSSVWTTEDIPDQHIEQQLVQQAGRGRLSLASVGNESSFFKKDATSDEHLCSTPSRGDDVDDQDQMLSFSQQASSPPPDWICTPSSLDLSPVSPPVTRDDRLQRSPPVTSALSGRRHGCVQMPQLTPIIEADNELYDSNDDDDDEGEVFAANGDAVAAKRLKHQHDSISSIPHHSDEPHTVTPDNLDLTIVTPMTSPELTPSSGSGSSKVTESGDLLPESDVDDQAGAKIVDDLTGNEVVQHESSFSGIYSSYVYGGDDYMRDPSPEGHQRDWTNVVEGDVRAQSAVLALSRRGSRLTYLNGTPLDMDTMSLPGDRVHGRYDAGRRQQQLHHQSHQRNSFTDDVQALENDEAITAAAADRSIRRRVSVYQENLI